MQPSGLRGPKLLAGLFECQSNVDARVETLSLVHPIPVVRPSLPCIPAILQVYFEAIAPCHLLGCLDFFARAFFVFTSNRNILCYYLGIFEYVSTRRYNTTSISISISISIKVRLGSSGFVWVRLGFSGFFWVPKITHWVFLGFLWI